MKPKPDLKKENSCLDISVNERPQQQKSEKKPSELRRI